MSDSSRRAAGSARGREAALRSLPKVDEVLGRAEVVPICARHGRSLVALLVRGRLAALRKVIRDGTMGPGQVGSALEGLAAWLEAEAHRMTTSSLRPVVNATGVVLHTNLGRAVMAEAAARRMVEVGRAYTTLEYDLGLGRRGSRSTHLDNIFALMFPGRAAHVVNNNAGAVFLVLNTLAEGREVVVSRGELVEIGDSFRIPDIMRKSGAILREIGTTNRTRLRDYERAIGPKTGLVLKVHTSNYRIVGFTAQVPLRELTVLGRRRRVPVVMDQGSGNMLDLETHGIGGEPSVNEALSAGADLVCFSGDKLLGGPQAGLIVGRRSLIARIRENPLSRALRVDKMTYAALEATLLHYVTDSPEIGLPVVRMIAQSRAAIEKRADRIVRAVTPRAGGITLAITGGRSVLGGGSAPDEGLPTALISIRSSRHSARAMEERLRRRATPVIARIEGNRVLLDLRTVLEEQDVLLERALLDLGGGD